MSVYTIYDPMSGEVDHILTVPDGVEPTVPAGKAVVPGAVDMVTHIVRAGAVVARDAPLPKDDEPVLSELDRVRLERDYKLAAHVDPYVCNPLRWDALSAAEQGELLAYRLALLDVPNKVAAGSPLEWPGVPSFVKLRGPLV